MGKKGMERATGMTQEERIANRKKHPDKSLNNTVDVVKEQKRINKYLKIWKHMKKHLKVGRVGV